MAKNTRAELMTRLSNVLDEVAHIQEHGTTPDSLGTLGVALRLALDTTSAYRTQLMEGR